MVKRPDGSWYLNVTASMHPSINILGELVDDGSEQNKNRRRKFRRDAGYPLAVSGVPPCGLPIVQTCNASSKFKADGDQWKALHVDDFMESYIDKTGVKSFDEFRSQAMQDFDSNVDDQRCDITSEAFSCSAPLSSDCTKSTDNDHKRGMIMTTALARFTAFYRSLWKTVDDLAGELSLEIDSITSTLYKPNPAQKWGQVMSISAAAVGFITAAAIVAATFLPEVFGAILVAIPTIAAAGAGTGGAIGALKSQSETDALFKQSGDYKTDARNMIHDISNSLNGSYSADMGGSGLASIFKGGSWVNHEVTEIFNKQGAGAQATAWFEKFMVAQVVTNILKSNDIYILFVPYGDDVKYSDQKWGFQKSDCESAWNNNPKWMFYADCNMKGGPKGEPGMAVFVRPYSVGAETAEWIKPVSFGDHQQIIGADILSSSLSGQTNHGFNYTFLDQDIGDIVAKEGMAGAQRMFGDVNLRTPGLFTVPVCVTSDLVNIPGVGRVMMDKKNGHGDTSSEAHSTDPCSCKSYTETTSGEEQSFTDYVSDNIADSFGPSCKVSGHTDRWGMRL
ncbi:hypothetical protein N7492_001006 [Penicillium capsulatum]|uniref:Uncharacterized protein n=1 Tax=Penicillium capsulatum TaxID=69766 RepID=A0A9W9IUP8_9EURO|nr:hypothetical protein N7492_001006 [Penicillium capsulatum]